MTTFFIIAAALVLAVTALIAAPLLSRRGEGPQAPWTVFAVLGVLLLGGSALYDVFSNWNWQQAAQGQPDQSPAGMVANLARRLAKHPDDLEGWLLLGHSYSVLNETPLAIRAYEKANALAKGGNADAAIGLAEELVNQDPAQLNGRAGALVEQALKLDPHNARALFYGGAAAISKRQFQLARDRFSALLAQNPPDNVKAILQQQINALDQQLGGAGAPPAAGSTAGAGAMAAAGQPGAQARQQAGTEQAGTGMAAAAGATVQGGGNAAAGGAPAAVLRLTITLSPKLKLDAPDAPLFVFVRDPRQGGPPLAVKRLSAKFPQTVELSSADAMIAGHGIAPGQDVEVVARISRGGGPTAQSGDPFGSAAWHVQPQGNIALEIDRQSP